MIVLERELSKKRNVLVVYNSSYYTNKNAWFSMSDTIKETYIISASSIIETLFELEPMLEENDGQLLTLEFLKDEEGVKGDVRDIRIKRNNVEWEIGLSIKHNLSLIHI